MPMSASRRPAFVDTFTRRPWISAGAAAAIGLVVLALLWDWNWFKGPVERAVEARTGRSFDIGGDLDVDLGSTVAIRADRLRLGNAEWSDEAEMATMERAGIRVHLPSLLFRRETRIPEIELIHPRVRLETSAEGGNWDMFGEPSGGTPPQIGRLWIEDGELVFLHPAEDTRIDIHMDSREASRADAAPPVAVEGTGQWRGNDFSLEGRVA